MSNLERVGQQAAQWARMLAIRPDGMSSSSRAHMAEGACPLQALSPSHMPQHCMCAPFIFILCVFASFSVSHIYIQCTNIVLKKKKRNKRSYSDNFLNMTKDIYEKTQLTLQSEKITPKTRNKTRIPTLPQLLNTPQLFNTVL